MEKFEIIKLDTSGEKCLVFWKGQEIDLLKIKDEEAERLVAEKLPYLKAKESKAVVAKAVAAKDQV